MKKILLILLSVLTKTQVFAYFYTNTELSFSKNNYQNFYFSLGISTQNYFISASFSQYSSDFLFKRKEISLSTGHEFENLKLSINFGLEPYYDGFSSKFIGLDLFYNFTINKDLNIGTGINLLYKTNNYSYTTTSSTTSYGRRKTISTIKTSEYKINETDKKLYIDLTYKHINITTSYTRISYTNTNLNPSIQKNISKFFITDGYIKYIISTSLTLDLMIFNIETSYTKASYLQTTKDTNSIYTSLYKDFERYSIGLGYEKYKDNQYSDKGDIYSLSISFYI